jgi:hypothetical protein
MFNVVGMKEGQKYSLRMSKGELSGDPFMIKIINRENDVDHGLLGLHPSVEPKGNYLDNEYSAGHLACICFDLVVSMENDWHEGIPKDAIF